EYFVDQVATARFLRESQVVAKLHHPHIVAIYELGESSGRPFFAMEYVDGDSLAKRLIQGPFPARQAAQLLIQLTEAIQHAHELCIVHRDLKPANVLLTANGEAKVADFGLAKVVDISASLTASGTIMGTPGYMAPEQTVGGIAAFGLAVDIYGLGAIL